MDSVAHPLETGGNFFYFPERAPPIRIANSIVWQQNSGNDGRGGGGGGKVIEEEEAEKEEEETVC